MSEPTQQISVIWPDVQDLPVYRANQFLGQMDLGPDGRPEDVILTLGHVAPPVILGTPDEQRASVMALGAVNVKALSRVSLSRGQAAQLVTILQTVIGQFDQAAGDSQ